MKTEKALKVKLQLFKLKKLKKVKVYWKKCISKICLQKVLYYIIIFLNHTGSLLFERIQLIVFSNFVPADHCAFNKPIQSKQNNGSGSTQSLTQWLTLLQSGNEHSLCPALNFSGRNSSQAVPIACIRLQMVKGLALPYPREGDLICMRHRLYSELVT